MRRLGLIGCVLIVIALDQAVKAWVLSVAVFNARDCIDAVRMCGQIDLGPFFDLTMVWNRGVSFGLLQSGGGIFLILCTCAISLGFGVWMVRTRHIPTGYSLALVVGGAVGNLIDRIRFAAVIDFLDFSGMYFPFVFNIADACISVGAAGLVVSEALARRELRE